MSARNVTAAVDALEQEGLVVRRRHPTDRRAVLVELTPAGVGTVAEALQPSLDAMGGIFEDVPLEERQQFLTVLGRLMKALRPTSGQG